MESKTQSRDNQGSLSSTELYTNAALCIALIVLILCGNALIVTAFSKNSRLCTGSYLIILSLAVSDILVGLVSVPVWTFLSFHNWHSNAGWEYALFLCFDILSASSSTLHLTALTIDRFLAVSRPFYHAGLSPGMYKATVMVLWLLATVLATSNMIVTRYFHHYSLLLLLGLIFGSLLIISCMNRGTFQIARFLIHNTPPQRVDNSAQELRRKIRRERATAATLVIVTALFFIAWLPHVIAALIFTFCATPSGMTAVWMLRLGAFIKWMQFSNSAVNPFVFAYRDSEIKATFASLLGPFRKRVFGGSNVIQPASNPEDVTVDSGISTLPP